MGLKDYFRHSRRTTKSKRWPALRHAAKRRDGFQCRLCGAHGRLEVDHINPVRLRPDLGFDLDNLQTLCAACHARKTRLEVGLAPLDPKRQRWRDLVEELRPHPPKQKGP